MKVLILFAHPAFHKSNVNKLLLHGIKNIPGVTFHDLYEEYADFNINVKREQKLLLEHDCIVFQHPFYWYSTPSIIKEWQDLVLEHGWAYGKKGIALKGKLFFNSITTGGQESAYQKDGYHQYTIKQLLVPVHQTAKLCKMIQLPPFIVHGSLSIDKQSVILHREKLFSILKKLTNDELDIEKAKKLNKLNDLK